MEIEKKIVKTNTFGGLKAGDVFLDKDDDVMMVVDKDYGLGDEGDFDGYAIGLKTGWLVGFNNDEDVIKVSAKLTITD